MDFQKLKVPIKEYLISISDNLFYDIEVDICNCIDVKHISFKVKVNWDLIPNDFHPVYYLNEKFTKDIQVFFKMICPKNRGYFNFFIINYRPEYSF